MTDGGRDGPASDNPKPPRSWLRAAVRLTPWRLRRSLEGLESELAGIRHELSERLAEEAERFDAQEDRMAAVERRLDAVEGAVRRVQEELGELREERVAPLERRLDELEGRVAAIGGESARLRDEVVPAVVARGNVLVDRLAEQIEELGSLVERILLGEPLPVPSAEDGGLAASLAEVQPLLLDAFRGDEREIWHRLEHYLTFLVGAAPVLDLGCGRGELLLLLREAGVEAHGVEADAALAQAARRRGLDVELGDVLEAVRRQPEGRWGAVTAIHLFEHLMPGVLLQLLAEVRRVLRPGGVLIAECPNPHTLRVGASLYWQDPTHARPLLPETLKLFLGASGLRVRSTELLHPFPDEQLLAGVLGDTSPLSSTGGGLQERLEAVVDRLDDLLNGPRDFSMVAIREDGGGS
jgi:O-antigen chain-terminating methyltransferase